MRYSFPGNVRELANELERAILLADPGAPITEDLLSDHVQEAAVERRAARGPPERTDDFERQQILAALERAGDEQDEGRGRAGAQLSGADEEAPPPRDRIRVSDRSPPR